MPKPLISIATFTTGMSPDQTDNAGFQTMYCLDPHTRPGVLRVQPRMDADDDTAVTELIRWFETYDDGSDVFLYLSSLDDRIVIVPKFRSSVKFFSSVNEWYSCISNPFILIIVSTSCSVSDSYTFLCSFDCFLLILSVSICISSVLSRYTFYCHWDCC